MECLAKLFIWHDSVKSPAGYRTGHFLKSGRMQDRPEDLMTGTDLAPLYTRGEKRLFSQLVLKLTPKFWNPKRSLLRLKVSKKNMSMFRCEKYPVAQLVL